MINDSLDSLIQCLYAIVVWWMEFEDFGIRYKKRHPYQHRTFIYCQVVVFVHGLIGILKVWSTASQVKGLGLEPVYERLRFSECMCQILIWNFLWGFQRKKTSLENVHTSEFDGICEIRIPHTVLRGNQRPSPFTVWRGLCRVVGRKAEWWRCSVD